ncbi:hypothetical protein AN403_5948 [Pseudomonas fluorescens]|uniref:Uncharacterized protein n=1 Tax=Pseudomonas fluorescens TaxID=294 RepID=A0A0P9BFV3_PSEFL|nr:hypothetical protein AN403_5948 [Pseudomonas fluorescens]
MPSTIINLHESSMKTAAQPLLPDQSDNLHISTMFTLAYQQSTRYFEMFR